MVMRLIMNGRRPSLHDTSVRGHLIETVKYQMRPATTVNSRAHASV